jgi:uncharacterized ferritin-like protein (DUF455 family)
MSNIGWFTLGDLKLREEPQRDSCFRVVRDDTEMEEHPKNTDIGRREMLHRHMSNEITSLDIAAQCLVDFPEAPWGLRMELARQCWDETRHVLVLWRRLRELGGTKGEFPISTFEWCITSAINDIAGRLATQNRTFEAGAMDIVAQLIRIVRNDLHDEETAFVLEGILADEVQHVRFANRWIRRLAAEDKRVLMRVAGAVRFLSVVNSRMQAKAGAVDAAGHVFESPEERIPSVNIEDRKLAEFSDDEIREILIQAGFRTLIPENTAETLR